MVDFKYKYVKDGNPGFRNWKGQATDNELVLNNAPIPYPAFGQTAVRDKRFIAEILDFTFVTSDLEKHLQGKFLVIDVQNYAADDLKKGIDRINSRNAAREHKKALEDAGEGSQFRAVECPHCGAAVDLSGLEASNYTYCPYCSVIFGTKSKQIIEDSKTHGICPECQTYGHISAYTDFFFYFLLFVYGWRYDVKQLCPTCASRMANGMFLKNAVFIIGLFPSAFVKIKAMTSGDGQMNKARTLSLRGAYQAATPIYEGLYASNPNHPGLLFNEAMGYMYGNDMHGASRKFEQSLKACANYYPTIRILQSMQRR